MSSIVTNVADRIVVDKDILPIFMFVGEEPAVPTSFQGTGFIAAPGVLVTCWHCVRAELNHDAFYGVALSTAVGEYGRYLRLHDVAQDPSGSDLATARIEAAPTLGLSLADGDIAQGRNGFTYGYPLTRVESGLETATFQLEGRFLQGYVTRLFRHNHPGFGPTPSYEIDMKAPAGLSGAPLVTQATMGAPATFAGVIYGSTESYTIAESESIDPETGDHHAEVRRLIMFGLAHATSTLRELSGPATHRRTIGEVLASDA